MHVQPTGYCQCGCGQRTRISHKTVRAKGWIKGQPLRFINGHNKARLGVGRPLDSLYHPEDRGHSTPCWIWDGAIDDSGYGRTGSKGPERLAYHATYRRDVGPVPEGMELDHLCRVRCCVNPAHLEPVTHAENQRRGLKTKLTADEVRSIRRLLAGGAPQVAIASHYGVCQQLVSCIKRGTVWADLND